MFKKSEYLASHDERRAMITGFDGSAGTAIVTQSEALLWTDGRYYQQAGDQLDNNWTLMKGMLKVEIYQRIFFNLFFIVF